MKHAARVYRHRHLYVQPEPLDITTAHINLANYLQRSDPAAHRAYLLVAMLIAGSAGMADEVVAIVHHLVDAMSADAGQLRLPRTVSEVFAVAELTEGVRLGDLLANLQPDRQTVLAQVLDGAETISRGQ